MISWATGMLSLYPDLMSYPQGRAPLRSHAMPEHRPGACGATPPVLRGHFHRSAAAEARRLVAPRTNLGRPIKKKSVNPRAGAAR